MLARIHANYKRRDLCGFTRQRCYLEDHERKGVYELTILAACARIRGTSRDVLVMLGKQQLAKYW